MTSWGLLLSVIGSVVVGWVSVRARLDKHGNLDFAGEFGKRPTWTILGWFLIVAGFLLQFIDSLRQG